MITQTILDYIKSQLDQGVDQNKIKADLMANGWSESDLQQALSSLHASSQTPIPNNVPTPPSNNVVIHKFNKLPLLIVSIVIVLLIAIGASAYIFGINPFSKTPYSENNFVSGLLKSFSEMKSGTYKVSGSVQVVEREVDIKPFEIKINDSEELKLKFMRDYDRAENVRYILNQLQNPKTVLPASLKSISSTNSYYKININDPLTKLPYDYKVIKGGQDFELRVKFETREAISAMNKSIGYNKSKPNPVVNGQEVTFTRETYSYFYLSQIPPVTFFESLNQSLQFMPVDMNVVFSLAVTSDWGSSGSKPEWKINLDATGDLGDLTYKANADTLKKGDVYYLRINNIPALFGFGIPKGQWLTLDPKELAKKSDGGVSYMPISPDTISDFEEQYGKEKAKVVELIRRIAKIADEEGVLAFKNNVKKEKRDDQWLYRYDLVIVQDKIVPFYKRLIKESQGSGDLIDTALATDSYLEQLESQEFKDIINYLSKSSSITFWIDNSGYLVSAEYSLKVAPPDDNVRPKDKQVVFTSKLEISDINKTIKIESPSGARPINEVFEEMFGSMYSDARAKGKNAAVKGNVSSIRTSAELVYDKYNGYGTKAFSLGPCAKTTGTLFADDMVNKSLMTATDNNISKATCGTKMVDNKIGAYVLSVPLPDDSTYNYCIDNTGTAKEIMGKLSGYSCSEIKY
jgi:hypothetical protein